MAALRFLALLSTGFVLLMLAFLLHVSHGRVEREGSREITGPDLPLIAGEALTWDLDFGGQRIEEAWPGVQRQPRLWLRGGGAGAILEIAASYRDGEGALVLDALQAGTQRVTLGEDPVEVGALWLSYDHPLRVSISCVEPGGGGATTPVLRGDPGEDYRTARTISRTVWMVFCAIGAASFALLLATTRGLFAVADDPSRR